MLWFAEAIALVMGSYHLTKSNLYQEREVAGARTNQLLFSQKNNNGSDIFF